MRNIFYIKKSWVHIFMLLAFFGHLCGTTLWHDNLNITTNVINDNLDISGTNELKNRVYIESLAQDILVTVTTNDSVITSSLQLHMYANLGRTITFDLTHDLIFRGSQTDFLITFSGQGTLHMLVKGNQALRFGSLPTTGAARFYIIGNGTATPPHMIMGRFPVGTFPLPDQNQNAYIQIRNRATFGFVAPTLYSSGIASERALLDFDPTNTVANTGRLVLQIENGGSFVIDGALIKNVVNPTLADLDLATLAGLSETVSVINTGTAVGNWSGLMVVNRNMTWPRLKINPFCETVPYTGVRDGFVLGANGVFTTNDRTYLDYVVTVTNMSLDPTITATVLNNPCQRFVEEVVKDRNPAAFIVDGDTNQKLTNAQIYMNGHSALYFRSGVDCCGLSTISSATVLSDQILSFTIDARKDIKTEGSVLFDIEGLLDVSGTVGGQNVLNILSLATVPTGGSVFIEGSDTLFPLRTFALDNNGFYLQYGSGCFMFNNRMNLHNATLQHTDGNHKIFENNIGGQSAPSYIGGESRTLGCGSGAQQNVISFYNSVFSLHTSAAATGVDFLVTNTAASNTSIFRFYGNGRCIDNGTGRSLVLGTTVGSLASDQATIINRNSHVDIIPEVASGLVGQTLSLQVGSNNTKVVAGITGNISGQNSIHTLFLGNASNISIGTIGTVGTDHNGNQFTLTTFPTLSIDGNYFSFTTQGGTLKRPDLSMTSGEGGMFVDTNGIVSISATFRSMFSMMVTKSSNGVVILPKPQVVFGARVGVALWQLNLGDPSQLTIISSGQNFSDLTIDWKNTIKDYCINPVNVPYEVSSSVLPGSYPAVTHANLIGLPTVFGSVDQLQIANPRLGDPARILVDGSQQGGLVREFVFQMSKDFATFPTGWLVVQNDAILGLGSASRNIDSTNSAFKLGYDGVTLVANGNGEIRLNQDMIVEDGCPILTGTLFGLNGEQRLVFESTVPKELRIKSDGVFDLTQFTNANQRCVFAGQVKLVLEPGAKVLLGGGDLQFTENSSVFCEPFINAALPVGTLPTATDSFRAKFIGTGRILFNENATMMIPRDAFVGVETDPILGFTVTSQQWIFDDASQLLIGGIDNDFGGSFQVGNTTDLSSLGHIVTFSLVMDGESEIDIESQGFLGFESGIADKRSVAPDNWNIGRLFNVGSVTLNFSSGTLKHQKIFPGSDQNASLLAVGIGPTYSFSVDRGNVDILGGGNMIVTGTTIPTFINPVVGVIDGVINPELSVGLLSSLATLLDTSKTPNGNNPVTPVVNGSATDLFNFLKMNSYSVQAGHTAALSKNQEGLLTSAYVDGVLINRLPAGVIRSGTAIVPASQVLAIGAVGLTLNLGDRAPAYAALNP